jgi:hypothetical protein
MMHDGMFAAKITCRARFQIRGRDWMTLDEAWVEFREEAQQHGLHVGMLEAMQLLKAADSHGSTTGRPTAQTAEQEERARFFDWLLHVKKDRKLAYEFLEQVGSLSVGLRQYWITTQGTRRAIAWESRATYPDSDSEIWDVIFVD